LSYVEKHLVTGETLQYETKLHWVVMLSHAALAAFLVAAAVALFVLSFGARHTTGGPSANLLAAIGFAAILGAAILLGAGAIKRSATVMALTNKRIIVKTGIATRRTIELLLSKIESIVVEEPAMGRLLGYGTVIIRGTGGTPEVFEKIARPLEFREQVQSELAAMQN
jgi:uncharacterized membrane protein YdbT with pleckstrin-like domain